MLNVKGINRNYTIDAHDMLPNKRQDAKWRLIDFTSSNRANTQNLSSNYVLYSNSMIKNIFLRPNVVRADQASSTSTTNTNNILPSTSSTSAALPPKRKPIIQTEPSTTSTNVNSNRMIDRVLSKKDDLNSLNKYVVEKIIESTKAKEAFLEAVIEKKLSDRINLYGVRSKSAKVELSVDNFKSYIHKINSDRNKSREKQLTNGSFQGSPRSNASVNFGDKYSGVKLNLRMDEPKLNSPRKTPRRAVSRICIF
jgi:hypothetical protein